MCNSLSPTCACMASDNVNHACRYVAETALAKAQLDAGSQDATLGPTGRQWFTSQEATGQLVSFMHDLCNVK